jgi:hypothetical protein
VKPLLEIEESGNEYYKRIDPAVGGNMPLIGAVSDGHVAVVRLLLDNFETGLDLYKGLDPFKMDVKTSTGKNIASSSTIDEIIQKIRPEVVELFIERLLTKPKCYQNPLNSKDCELLMTIFAESKNKGIVELLKSICEPNQSQI